MTPAAPTAFEDQLTAGLHRRAAAITALPGGRDRIDARVAGRARGRRIRRVGIVAAALVALLAGAIAMTQRGHEDTSVVTVPGTPAVHIPQLGLRPDLGASGVVYYTPGRVAEVGLYPELVAPNDGTDATVANPALGAQLLLRVSDVSPAEYVEPFGADATIVECSVGNQPAKCVSPHEAGSRGIVAWQPADGILASLSVSASAEPESAGARAERVAGDLVEMDSDAWWTMSGSPVSLVGLGLAQVEGHAELALYAPSDQGGSSGQVFDASGWPPGTFELITSADSRPRTPLPTEFAGVKIQEVTVRGAPAVVTTILRPSPPTLPFGYSRSVIWVEGGFQYRLDFTDEASVEDAVAFAGRLTTLTSDEWHDLLFPSTIRVDLVPTPTVRPILGPPAAEPSASTVLSLPTDPSTPPPTGD